MAKDEFTPFSRSLNPFRGIERNIDAMFDDSFATGAAGAMAQTHRWVRQCLISRAACSCAWSRWSPGGAKADCRTAIHGRMNS